MATRAIRHHRARSPVSRTNKKSHLAHLKHLSIYAYILTITSPFEYYASQAPNSPITPADFPGQALGLSLAMGNIFVLLALLAVICSWTKHPDIIKRYLLAVALADFGHCYATYRAVGSEYFFNFGGWNDMTWGNVGVSVFLHINRLATVMGVFGNLSETSTAARKEQNVL